MSTMDENIEFLENKYLLLDTNILIDSVKYTDDFTEFFQVISSKKVVSVLDSIVKFEFFRGARNRKEYSGYRAFLDELLKKPEMMPLPNEEDYLNAQRIAAISLRSNNKDIKFPDCLIGAMLIRYSHPMPRLFLATQNHRDFTPTLFTLEKSVVIRLDSGNIKTVGIYSFNLKRFNEMCEDLPEELQFAK